MTHLNVLSYNIQVGIPSTSLQDYLLSSWLHMLPGEKRHRNLRQIAQVLKHYDLVGLQEADAGSYRSNQVNLVDDLAKQAGFLHWRVQKNRHIGTIKRPVAAHSNGLLSRARILDYQHHPLPGPIAGRGVILASIDFCGVHLTVAIVHLSLGKKSRQIQLDFLFDLLKPYPDCLLMGDFNESAENLSKHELLKSGRFYLPGCPHTYPSWNPARSIDHILVKGALKVAEYQTLSWRLSDHLPVSLKLTLK